MFRQSNHNFYKKVTNRLVKQGIGTQLMKSLLFALRPEETPNVEPKFTGFCPARLNTGGHVSCICAYAIGGGG
jgi:hypothetical protein